MADKFYPPFPKKYVIGQYTFVEPDFKVKFPVFHCCQSHRDCCTSHNTDVDYNISTTKENLYQNYNNNKTIINNTKDFSNTKNFNNNNTSNFRTVNLPFTNSSIKPPIYTIPPSPPSIPFKRPSISYIAPASPPPPVEAKSSVSFSSLVPSTSEASKLIEPKSEIEHEAMDQFVLSEQGNKSGFWLSFIRPNLVFDVLPKSLMQFRKTISHFQSIYPNGSGIIFCMSKKECDTVTDMVRDALPYHMDLPDAVRTETQRRWEMNEVKILCATLAFGKTVNKPNVRFVIHHTMPQSLEQYERQCALAGTDGQLSHCVLLYSFNDHLRVLRLIKEDVPKPPPNVMAMKEGSLRNVLRYCENVTECRRKKLASSFGEKYSAEQCIATAGPCTLCEALMDGKQPLKLYDFTREALAVFSSMGMLRNTCITYISDLFRGSLTKKRVKQTMDDNRHGRLPLFGLGSGLTDADCQRFIQKLVIDDYLYLNLTTTKHGTVIGYANLAKKGSNFLNRYKQQENVPPNERIYLHVSDAKEKRRSSKGNTDLDGDDPNNKRKRLSSVF
uniref:DNA 3'-5' helicase n=1 Tax=Meloidogyne hapla TaxID=6305 RepID=A0A1I8BDD3_MELHA